MRGSIIAVIAVLGGCAVPEEGGDRNETAAVQSSPSATDENEIVSEPVKTEPGGPSSAMPAPEDADACGASSYQHLVGQPRSGIPEPPEGANWRIACSSCPVTMDYSPSRMNIFYDEETEIIEEVKCG